MGFAQSFAIVLAAVAAPSPEDTVIRETRVFDIRFLTEEIPDFPLPEGAGIGVGGLEIRSPDSDEDEESARSFAFGQMEEVARGFDEPPLGIGRGQAAIAFKPFEEAAPAWTRIDPKALVALIRQNIAEDSWANKRNTIKADERELIVHQTPDVIAAIDRLLARLRAQRARMIAVEVAVVPAEVLGHAGRSGSPWLSSDEYDRILDRAGDRATPITLMAYDGQTVSGHAGPRRTMLSDRQVNQTGVSPVVNPVISVVRTGVLAGVRPESIAGTDWILLRLRVIRRRLAEDPEPYESVFGQVEPVRTAVATIATTTIVRAGEAVVAGCLEGADETIGTLAAIARVRPLTPAGGAQDADPRAEGFVRTVYDVRFLMGTSFAVAPTLATRPTTPSALMTYLRTNIAQEGWNDARAQIEADRIRLTVVQTRAVHEAIRALLDRWRAEVLCLVSIECRSLRGTRGALNRLARIAGRGGVLPDDWETRAGEGLASVATARLVGIPGARMMAHGHRIRSYVADYECVSGGTGWTLTNMPDPIVQTAGSGFQLAGSARIIPGGRAWLDLDAVNARTRFERKARFHAAWDLVQSHIVRPGEEVEKGKEEPPAGRSMTVMVPVEIDLPDQDAWVLDRSLPLPADRSVLIESRADGSAEDPGRATIVRIGLWRGEEVPPAPPAAPAGAPAAGAGARRAARILETEIIGTPVRDASRNLRAPGSILVQSPDEENWDEYGEGYAFGYSPGLAVLEERMVPVFGFSIGSDTLEDVIHSAIAEDTWANERNALVCAGGELIAVQSPDVLDRIEAYVEALHAERLREVDIDIAIIPRREADGGEFDALVEEAGEAAIRWRVTACDGETVALDPPARFAALWDYEVNQTGVSPVINPYVRTYRSGLGVWLQASATPRPDASQLAFGIARLRKAPSGDPRKVDRGDLQIIENAGAVLRGSVLAEAGKTVVLGELSWPEAEPGSFTIIARVRPVPVERPARSVVRILDVGALVMPWSKESDPLYEPSRLIDELIAGLDRRITGRPEFRLRHVNNSLFLSADGDPEATARAGDAAARLLETLFRRRVKTAGLRVWMATVAPKDLAGVTDAAAGHTLLVPDWRTKLAAAGRVTAIRLDGFAGQSFEFWAGSGRTYLADVEKVSGGTGWTLTEVDDPIMQWAGTGIEVRGSVGTVPGNPWVQIRLSGAAAETTFGRTRWLRSNDRFERDPEAGVRPIGAKVDIDLPEQMARTWKHVVTVPAGRACLLGASPDPQEPAKLRILVAEGWTDPRAIPEEKSGRL